MELTAVHLAQGPPSSTYDVRIEDDNISSIKPSTSDNTTSDKHSILLPSLCHPHIHLDKAFILSSDHPQYADLVPNTGTFQEALSNTAKAKGRYTRDDLERRGSQLIADSIRAGVSAIRAFVEVDHVVQFLCLEVACALKKRFAKACHVQIVAFAQDPIFSSEHGEENRGLLEEALKRSGEFGIDVLGTTPYVEADGSSADRNVRWAIQQALKYTLHVDFHLDYHLDGSTPPMIYNVLGSRTIIPQTVALAHCTRLTLLPDPDLSTLATRIRESKLPISFIGLPTSDLYMMGRPPTTTTSSNPSDQSPPSHHRPRGTLLIPDLIRTHNLNAALSLNNLSNPFTPHGTADPLQLASWGVGLYHAGTEQDADLLYECVSTRARRAIGLPALDDAAAAGNGGISSTSSRLELKVHSGAGGHGGEQLKISTIGGLLLFEAQEDLRIEGLDATSLAVPGREIRSVKDVVWCPPETSRRRIISGLR
jgi:hypothetical protein